MSTVASDPTGELEPVGVSQTLRLANWDPAHIGLKFYKSRFESWEPAPAIPYNHLGTILVRKSDALKMLGDLQMQLEEFAENPEG